MQRGDVYRFKLPKDVGHEQQGHVSVSSSRPMRCCPGRLCWSPRHLGVRGLHRFGPKLSLLAIRHGCSSSNSVLWMSERLGRRVGTLPADEMWAVDDALITVLGLT